MKEIEKIEQAPIEQVKEVKSEKRYKGTYRLHQGHIVWELHYETNEIRPAEVVRHFDMKKKETRTELVEKDGCLYMMALNKKNARKKFDKAIEVAKEKLKKKPWAAKNETHINTMNTDKTNPSEATETKVEETKSEETNESCQDKTDCAEKTDVEQSTCNGPADECEQKKDEAVEESQEESKE